MERIVINPRQRWQDLVENLGFYFHTIDNEIYWDESAYYHLSLTQVDQLEQATEVLHDLCEKAVRFIIENKRYEGFGFSPLSIALIEQSYHKQSRSLYGRFDLAYDGTNHPKMLEYNADTPTALFEASVIQWEWLQSLKFKADQFNSIHEKLIEAWQELIPSGELVHLCGFLDNREDYGTLAYLADTALQVTKQVKVLELQNIALRRKWFKQQFCDEEGFKISYLFKLYPWEWMVKDEFAFYLLESDTTIFEPAWHMILQNKNILTVLWELFPDCPYLLPAYSSPEKIKSTFVSKIKEGREGDGVFFCKSIETMELPKSVVASDFIYQEWFNVPNFEGNYPTIGSWIINGRAAGIGIREDKSPIAKNSSRFVPHCFS